MRLITNVNDIKNMINTKKTIEQYLVLEILDQFNSGTLIRELRGMAEDALEQISKAPRRVVREAYKEEKFLAVWKRLGDISNVHRQVNRMTASEVSDIIRFFGTVIEKGGAYWKKNKIHYKIGPNTFSEEDEKKKKYRVGSEEGTFNPDLYRLRSKGIKNYNPDWMENLVGSSQNNRGIVIKRALDKGVLGKIENTFGLWKGAAISGTTADTVYFIDRFGKGLDPLLNLLPVATLTYNYHHALVEIAMVLTNNARMNYSIGSYTTLLPHKSSHQATGSIKGILKRFEDRIDNKLMLIFYAGTRRIDGCLLFDKYEEKRIYKKFATANMDLWRKFAKFSDYPRKYEIASFDKTIADRLNISNLIVKPDDQYYSTSVHSRIREWEAKRFRK